MTFKDLFSTQSADYARFRPRYPEALFSWLAALAPGRVCALDVATGNGQAALALAQHFEKVVAVDASAAQLSEAPAHAHVVYRVGQAEATGVADATADLLTAAQAFHWFRQDAFFAEAARVLRPGGVLAVWSYGLMSVTPAVDALVQHLYGEVLGSYWEPERRLVEQEYAGVTFPFTPIPAPRFEMVLEWDLAALTGYLRTWSAQRAYVRARGIDPVVALGPELARAWGPGTHTARWTLALHVSRR